MRSNDRAVRFVNPRQCWQKELKPFAKFPPPKLIFEKKDTENTLSKLMELSSDIPGLKNVFDSRRGSIFNALWFLVICCSSLVCLYQIIDRLQLFLSDPIDSRVTVKQNETVKFPSLTICAPEGRYVSLVSQQQLKATAQNINHCDVKPEDLMPELNISTIWSLMNTDGLIHYASILTRLNEVHPEPIVNFTKKSILTYYGNCTTFSINQLVPFKGEDYKIEIRFLKAPMTACGTEFHSSMYFFHHDDDDVTYTYITENSLQYDGRVFIFGIEAKMFKAINRTSAPCDSVAVVSKCERRCIENILKKQIPCRLPFMHFDDIPLCANSKEARVAYKHVFFIAKQVVYSKNCSCPDRCEKLLYSRNLMHSSAFYYPVLQYLFGSNVIVDIQEYRSYTLIPFICDVGGNLGLFLGLCIPTIIDILQNIFGYFFTKIITKRVN